MYLKDRLLARAILKYDGNDLIIKDGMVNNYIMF